MAGEEKVRLQVNNAADVHFTGVLLHEYSTQNRDGTKPRWTELRLWETRDGAWIAESVGCSDRAGEAALRDVLVIEPDRSQRRAEFDDEQAEREQAARVRVMNFFGWSTVAKAFAKAAGWDVVRRVD